MTDNRFVGWLEFSIFTTELFDKKEKSTYQLVLILAEISAFFLLLAGKLYLLLDATSL